MWKPFGIKYYPTERTCTPGQGEHGESIHSAKANSLDECLSKCKKYDGCVAIDFTVSKRSNRDSCRFYGNNNARSNPGIDDRMHCTNINEGKDQFVTQLISIAFLRTVGNTISTKRYCTLSIFREVENYNYVNAYLKNDNIPLHTWNRFIFCTR